MGRRGVRVEDEARWVFNRLADAYRHRPGYPQSLVERVAALARGSRVVELGAGTGLLANALATRGLDVTAVEPARAMLDVLRARDVPGVRCLHAAAEDTGLEAGAFGFAVLADALHWVDPERTGHELARILAPGATVGVIEVTSADTPFMREVDALLASANPRARRQGQAGALQQLLRLAGVQRWEAEVFDQELALDDAALEGTVRSLSFAGPAVGEDRLRALMEDIRAAALRHGGARWARTFRLTWGRRGSADPDRVGNHHAAGGRPP